MDIEQLAAEMRKGFEALSTRIDKMELHVLDRIDAMEKRVQRQGTMVQGGSRVVTRLAEWSEDTDTELMRHAARITDLENRLDRLDVSK